MTTERQDLGLTSLTKDGFSLADILLITFILLHLCPPCVDNTVRGSTS